jgi:uncharacterized alkaline shock family protein YloU
MAHPNVTISPDVIRTVVKNTVLAMPGVRGLVSSERRLGSRGYAGVEVRLDEDTVRVTLHVAAAADTPLAPLGRQIQSGVADVVEEIVGLKVASVDVMFEDVKA